MIDEIDIEDVFGEFLLKDDTSDREWQYVLEDIFSKKINEIIREINRQEVD